MQLTPIGHIRSCYSEKFGIPRQPGLVPEAAAVLEIAPPYHDPQAFRGLEAFSHIWILFLFHANAGKAWRPTVRPPRLGGNRRIGLFASRSGFRPNPIGQSVVELTGLEARADRFLLHLRGIDLLDGTPVLDVKPYLPYADSLPHATAGYAEETPAPRLAVNFAEGADAVCRKLDPRRYPQARQLIAALLAHDPRPAYREAGDDEFGMRLWDLNIRFKVVGQVVVVISIDAAKKQPPSILQGYANDFQDEDK
jgi:tRNA-Thr(GGU) m(6)t(6)A37 methyltransferase TsaA